MPLRLRNLLADAGDKAMINAKLRSVDPLLRVLSAKLCQAAVASAPVRTITRWLSS